MYNYLINATKNRIISEFKDILSRHPNFKTLEIFNRYPYNERIQEGIIVKNTSAGRQPISADNFQGNVYSYVTVAKHKNFPGMSIEWVREDESHLTTRIYKQDFSNSTSPIVGPNNAPIQIKINIDQNMLKGGKDLSYADDIRNVEVFVNNSKIVPLSVDGEKKEIIISSLPMTNPKIEVSYWIRNLAPAGIYQLEIIGGNPVIGKFEFMLDVLLDKYEVLIEQATGKETSVQLSYSPVFKKSLILKENNAIMTENVDYFLDENTGIITFNSSSTPNGEVTILKNSKIEASYRVKGLSTGPFEIPNPNYANNTAIPGVVLAFGNGVSIGDKHFIIINNDRILTALEYSGKWDLSISLDIFAKDSYKIEEIIDITTSYLNTYRKEELDAEGIYLVDVSFGGESEEVYDDATGDLYYKGSVDYKFLTEWIMHKPLIEGSIDGYILETNTFVNPKPYIEDEKDTNKKFENIK